MMSWPSGGQIPSMGGTIPPMGGAMPHMGSGYLNMGATMSHMGGAIPPMGNTMPPMIPSGNWNPGSSNSGPSGNVMAYGQDQWMQQNWQSWMQWQQQYAQWQSQYGEKYAQQMQTMSGMPPLPLSSQPPAPPPPDQPPPPPPHENNQPLFTQPTPVAPPQNPSNSNNICIDAIQNTPSGKIELQQNTVNSEALKKLEEEEKLFNIQFKKWEEEIEKWKKDNVNHPDKKAYMEYETKFEACRAQLLERRQQMNKKRAALLNIGSNSPIPAVAQTSNQNSNTILAQHNSNTIQAKNNSNTKSFNFDQGQSNTQNNFSGNNQYHQKQFNYQFNKPPPPFHKNNVNIIDVQSTYDSKGNYNAHEKQQMEYDQYTNDNKPNFLPATVSGKGIPGLDLVPAEKGSKSLKNLDVIEIPDDEVLNQYNNSTGKPDLSTISKGINNILGDEKIMSMLSMVKNFPSNSSNNVPNSNYMPPNQWEKNQPNRFNNQKIGGVQPGHNNGSNQGHGFEKQDNYHQQSVDYNRHNSDTNSQYNEFNRENDGYNKTGGDFNWQSNNSNRQDNDFNRQGFDSNRDNGGFNKQGFGFNRQGGYNAQGNNNNRQGSIGFHNKEGERQDMNKRQGDFNQQGNNFNNIQNESFNQQGNNRNHSNNFNQQKLNTGPNNQPFNDQRNFPQGPQKSGLQSLMATPLQKPPLIEKNPQQNFQGRPDNQQINEQPETKWSDEPLFEASIIVEYDHKPLRLKVREFIDPVQKFEYNHTSKELENKKKLQLDSELENLYPRARSDHDIHKEIPDERRPWHERSRNEYGRDNYSNDYERRRPRDNNEDSNRRRENYEERLRSDRFEDRRHDEKDRYSRREDNIRDREYDRNKDRERDRDIEKSREFDRQRDDRNSDRRRNERKKSRTPDRYRDSRKRGRSKDSTVSDESKKAKESSVDTPKHIVMIDDILEPPGREMRPDKIVVILRGPPGSGKSYIAKLIRDKEAEYGGTTRILSIDDYFMQEGEIEETDPATGKKTKKPSLKYEYDEKMEENYMNSLKKAFKRTITDGYFTFLVFDAVNDHLKCYADIWNFARQNGFQVYVCTLDLNAEACFKRNIHNRSKKEIEEICGRFFSTPAHHIALDATTLLQNAAITEVHMEDVTSDDDVIMLDDDQNEPVETSFTSKWEKMDKADQLARLDGTSKPLRPSQISMEDYLQLDEWKPNSAKPGKKTVRWADIEESREQEKLRAIGFVVGQTDWNRMTDPTMGSSALTQTKYIERVKRI